VSVWLDQWLASGRLFDLALLVLLVEALWLWSRARRDLAAPPLRSVLPNLLAGAALIAALRAMQGGAGTPWLLALLLVALGAHLLDLRQRWP
jgi:uncharacterized iron-regulated membrane protein